MRNFFKNIVFLRVLYALYLASQAYFRFKLIAFIRNLWWFFKDFSTLKKAQNPNFKLSVYHTLICINDKTSQTNIEPVYFLQNNWASKKIFEIKPKELVDVGSSVNWVGIISQFVPVTFVDIRPMDIKIEEIQFKEASILNLPFNSDSIGCISSLCVVEHIGLGRYGDRIDSFGSEKAIKELIRVTKQNGDILFSVPVDIENRIYFNAHRAFTRAYILELFNHCELIEERYIYEKKLENNYKAEFGTGLYWFKKK
jgi:SAM-dependent methyltransferase